MVAPCVSLTESTAAADTLIGNTPKCKSQQNVEQKNTFCKKDKWQVISTVSFCPSHKRDVGLTVIKAYLHAVPLVPSHCLQSSFFESCPHCTFSRCNGHSVQSCEVGVNKQPDKYYCKTKSNQKVAEQLPGPNS